MHVLSGDVLFALFVATAGVGLGWLLRGLILDGARQPKTASRENVIKIPVRVPQPTAPAVEKPVTSPSSDISHGVLAQLHEIASNMASNVGEHNSRVQAISNELSEVDPGANTEATVLAAVNKLMEANAKMHEQLATAEQRLFEQDREIELHAADARTDALTSLGNRRAFDDELAKAHAKFQSRGEPVCVSIIDVDFFKKFNDTYGHQAGDEVLRGVGRVLAESVGSQNVAVRYGGEEFALIFPGSSVSAIKQRADEARAAIDTATFHFEGKDLHVTASLGLAELLPGECIELLVKRADEALYASKEAGRNCSHWHDGENCIPLPNHGTFFDDPDEVSDSLSQLASREDFCKRVTNYLAKNHASNGSATVILLQIDNYNRLLNNRGQGVTNLVLKATRQFFNAMIEDRDDLARFDEDVFSMLLSNVPIHDAISIAERLRQAISRCRLPFGGSNVRFTVSLGVAESRTDESTEELIERAKETLALAVDRGPNVTYYHDGDKPQGAVALKVVAT